MLYIISYISVISISISYKLLVYYSIAFYNTTIILPKWEYK